MHKIAFCAALLIGSSALAMSQPAMGSGPKSVGLLLVAHGGDSLWNAPVLQLAKEFGPDTAVEVALLMGPYAARYRFQDAVARLLEQGATGIVIVPLLVSSHSGHYEQIRYLAGLTDTLDPVMHHHLEHAGIRRPEVAIPIRLASALDDAPELAEILVERALALAHEPARQAVLLLGHGPNSAEEYAEWMLRLRRVADSVAARGGFADVRVELLREDAPPNVRAEAVRRAREIVSLQYRFTERPVVVVPVLLSRGGIARGRLEADLAGLPIVLGRDPLLPHRALSRWVRSRLRAP
jgi:sirohydrochlorin cobaltochelatase